MIYLKIQSKILLMFKAIGELIFVGFLKHSIYYINVTYRMNLLSQAIQSLVKI